MTDLLLAKKERDLLFSRITTLQTDLNVATDNANFYREQMIDIRQDMVKIYNASGAKTVPEDDETERDSWKRLANSIIERLSDAA